MRLETYSPHDADELESLLDALPNRDYSVVLRRSSAFDSKYNLSVISNAQQEPEEDWYNIHYRGDDLLPMAAEAIVALSRRTKS